MAIIADASYEKHLIGDEDKAKRDLFEHRIRCLWLLDLYGTTDRLGVAMGQDARIESDGKVIFRQIKKREKTNWTYAEIKDFLTQAYHVFQSDPSVSHEFYTNNQFATSLVTGGSLTPNEGIRELAGEKTQAFCDSIKMFAAYKPLDGLSLELAIRERLRIIVRSHFPLGRPDDILRHSDWVEITARLEQFESALVGKGMVGWEDVEAAIGLAQTVSELALRTASLVPIETFLSSPEPGPLGEAALAFAEGKLAVRAELEAEAFNHIDQWWEMTQDEASLPSLRIILLTGAHGSGRSWTAMSLASQMRHRCEGLNISVAHGFPPDNVSVLDDLSILHARPHAVILDEIAPDWMHIIRATCSKRLRDPLLIIGTATRDTDNEWINQLASKLTKDSLKIVRMPDYIGEGDLAELAKVIRTVGTAKSEQRKAIATNIREAARQLKRERRKAGSTTFPDLAGKEHLLNVAIPVLTCASLGVKLSKGLLERSVGVVPKELKPWILGASHEDTRLLSFESKSEAVELLDQSLGEGKAQRQEASLTRLLGRVSGASPSDRSFARNLLLRLSKCNKPFAAQLLQERADQISKVLENEPLWALVFTWIPVYEAVGDWHSLEPFLTKATITSISTAEIALIVAAYGAQSANSHLLRSLTRSLMIDGEELAVFLQGVHQLPRYSQKAIGRSIAKMLVNLGPKAFYQVMIRQPNFVLATNLAVRFGNNADRLPFMLRTQQMLEIRQKHESKADDGWFEVTVDLVKRVITQHRRPFSRKALDRALDLTRASVDFERTYNDCLNEEATNRHQHIINVGTRMLEWGVSDIKYVPQVGKLFGFVKKWGDNSDKSRIFELGATLLETYSDSGVPFDRVSALALPMLRYCDHSVQERLLACALAWLSDENYEVTQGSIQLMIQCLVLLTYQKDTDIASRASSGLLSLANQGWNDGRALLATLEVLEAHLGSTSRISSAYQRHTEVPFSVIREKCLYSMPRAVWPESHWEALLGFLDSLEDVGAWLYVCTVLLHINEPTRVLQLADKVSSIERLKGPLVVYRARAYAMLGDLEKAEGALIEYHRTDKGGDLRVNPDIISSLCSRLVQLTQGRKREYYLFAAELWANRWLRPYHEFVAQSKASEPDSMSHSKGT